MGHINVDRVSVNHVNIRPALPADLSGLAAMCQSLWPDASAEEHAQEMAPLLAGKTPSSLPWIILLAEEPNGQVIGFVEAQLRSCADGCDPAHPVGYVEGWYVMPEYRRQRVGAQLIAAAEVWARTHGCTEMASDTWIDALESQHAHQALGFEVVDRCVHYRKLL